ncbi:MAG: TlpA family protein disulfide reductase [Chloroflexota bacterium]|nr:TlpA family protein disulfide reductase [Chloroflexota bacterium]MBI5704874.1 TlpA family protein disulfide reductase [Chloroflexota bacterium]
MTESTNIAPARKGVPLWVQVIIWVFLAGLLGIVAMGLNRAQQGTIQPGHAVDDFTLPLYSGYEYQGASEVKLSELRGKIVVINFWASWCKPCEQEAAELQSAWEQYEPTGEVVFLGVDYVDTEPQARVYLKKFGITFPNGPDLATRISQYFRIKGVPETYFIDREGVLRYVQVGPFTSLQQIQNIIDPLLSE